MKTLCGRPIPSSRGNAWLGKCDYDKAIADFNQALAIHPNYAQSHNNLA